MARKEELNKILFLFDNNKNIFQKRSIPKTVSAMNGTGQEDEGLTISIIGVNKIFDSSTSIPRKILWIASLLTCCSIVIYYVSMRVNYILSMPTQVAVTLRQNETLQLPDITICPAPIFLPANLKSLGMNLNGTTTSKFTYLNKKFNVTNLWLQLTPPRDFIAVTVVNMDISKNWQLRFTTQGVCYTHKYGGSIQASGLNFGMQIMFDWQILEINLNGTSLSETVGLQLYLHAPQDEALTELEGISIGTGEDISVAIRIKEFLSLSREEHPCEEKIGYSKSKCVNECFNNALHQLIKCKLPFMTSQNSTEQMSNKKTEKIETKEEEDWCDTRDIYDEAFSIFWKSKSNLTLWANCGQLCLIECQKFVYTPYIESVAPSRNNIGKLNVYFPEMFYATVREKEFYDLIALLCDIGGTFGLLLGCSILTLVELIEKLIDLTIFRFLKIIRKK